MPFSGRELQINTHPNDVRHFPAILAHLRRVWGGQVDRFRVTLDQHNSVSGRYRSTSYQENARLMATRLKEAVAGDSTVVIDTVDYSEETRRKIASEFFDEEDVPAKAWDGGPFYSYLYGLWSSQAETLVHMDGDMMFGGLSPHWLGEAEARMRADPKCLFVAPLAGPPNPGGPQGDDLLQPGRALVVEPGRAYSYSSVSTRIFVTDTRRFRGEFLPLDHLLPTLKERFKAQALGNPPLFREFERILSETMRTRGYYRLDLLGSEPGMWSLHPPFRNENFYAILDTLIGRIERGDVPDVQRGRYDIVSEMCDWSDARTRNARWRRLARQGQRALTRFFE